MENILANKNIAVIVADGFEETEFTAPVEALQRVGANVDIISIRGGSVKAWNKKDWGRLYPVYKTIDHAKPEDYDALVLPGGVMNPDQLRMDKRVVAFVSDFMTKDKPIGAICHGPWTLIETKQLEGKTLTSWPSLKTDLINAGATWIDKEVVIDGNLVTSRKPDDLPAFCQSLVEIIAESVHA